jgi:hypothetical protein
LLNIQRKNLSLFRVAWACSFSYLIKDGLLERFNPFPEIRSLDTSPESYSTDYQLFYITEYYRLTPVGREFINHWLAPEPLDDSPTG